MKHAFRIILVTILTIGLLALFLRNSEPDEVIAAISSTNPLWFGIALVVNFLALVGRAERWRTILNPDDPPPFYPTFFATALGFMSSAILPIRAGDVVRPALLSRRTTIRFSTALGTVLIERVLDLLSILLLFSSFVGITLFSPGSMPRSRLLILQSAGTVALLLFAGMLTFVVSLYFFQNFVRRLHEWLARFLPSRFRASWMRFFDSFVASLAIARKRRAFGKIVLLTAVVWICLTSQFYFVMLAMERPLPFHASFLMIGATIVGFAIPTPGGVGGFHKASQIVLTTFFGFDVSSSVAVALVFHVVGTAPVLVTGLILFSRERLSWRQLARIGENTEE